MHLGRPFSVGCTRSQRFLASGHRPSIGRADAATDHHFGHRVCAGALGDTPCVLVPCRSCLSLVVLFVRCQPKLSRPPSAPRCMHVLAAVPRFCWGFPLFVLGLSFKRRRLFTPVVIAARPQLRARRSSVSLPYAAICRSVLLLFCSLRFCAHRCVQVPPPSGVVATLLMFFSNLPLRHTPLAAFSPQDLTCVTTCKAQASPPVPRPAVTPLVCLHCLSEHAQHMDRQNIVPVPLARSRMSRVLVSHGQPAAMPRLRRRLKSVWPTPLSPPLRVPLTPPRCLPFVAVAVSRRRCLRASRHAASDFACH